MPQGLPSASNSLWLSPIYDLIAALARHLPGSRLTLSLIRMFLYWCYSPLLDTMYIKHSTTAMAPTHFIHLLANLDFVIVLALFEVEELVTDLLKKSLSEILFQEVYV